MSEERAFAEMMSSAGDAARSLSWSIGRIGHLMPLEAASVEGMSEEDQECVDAFLFRFGTLSLVMEQQLEGLLSTDPGLCGSPGEIARLAALREHMGGVRDRFALRRSESPERQSQMLNEWFEQGREALEGYNEMLSLADKSWFEGKSGIAPVPVPESKGITPNGP